MLVLTRKPREEIRIGNGITITILRVKGQSVRVGIDAPNDIRIVRGELKPEMEESADASVEVEPSTESNTNSTDSANAKTNADRSSATRSRCERNTNLHANPVNSNASCSSRLTHRRRNVSTLKSLVARNRAANPGPPQ